MNAHLWVPFQIRVLVPEKGHRASQLDMGKYVLFSCIFGQENQLSLCSVGSIPIEITASGDPPFTLPAFVPPGDKSDFTGVVDASVGEVDNNKARYEPSDPVVGFDFDEIVDPVAVVHVRKAFVFHGAVCVNEGLEGVGEVILVTEVEVLGGEHVAEALDVDPVLFGLVVGETVELDFLDLEDFAVVDLPDD